MTSILRLIRFPNLLMLFITVFVYGQYVLYDTIAAQHLAPSFRFKDFLSLLFIFACVAAAGYIHNDITDFKTDHSNNKRKIIGQKIARWTAWTLLWFFIISPLPLVYYLCSEIDNYAFLGYYFGVVIILLGYNKWFQRLPLIGNIIVAACCGLVIILPALAEINAVHQIAKSNSIAYERFWIITIGFVVFAFFANLIREILKDIEDIDGDRSDHYNTLPIAIGIRNTVYIIVTIEVILLILLSTWIGLVGSSTLIIISLTVLMIAPLLFLIYASWNATKEKHFINLCHWMKFYFAAGIISLFIIS